MRFNDSIIRKEQFAENFNLNEGNKEINLILVPEANDVYFIIIYFNKYLPFESCGGIGFSCFPQLLLPS